MITLTIKGMTIPNFKNSKRWLTKLPNGKPLERPFLITDPKVRKLMDRITDSFECQLRSIFQIADGETVTEPMKRSLIASLLPSDDCWTEIPKTVIEAELCEPGNEGVVLTIERL